MKKIGLYGVLAALLLSGCMTTSTRDRAFTDDWADHVRKQGPVDRRNPAPLRKEEPLRLGPATVTKDESGRPRLNLGGDNGLGVDFESRGGRVRYRRKFDFVRPERSR